VDRAAKKAFVAEMKEIFETTPSAILVNYQGLEVNKMVELRKKLNSVSSKMRILKNTLAKISAEGTPFEALSEQFVGTRALIFGAEDPVQQAKMLLEFAEENSEIEIQGGILANEGRVSVLNEKDIKALATLPSKEELIVKVLFLMQAPATQFVRTLHEVPAKFVRVLAAIADSKN